MKKISIITLSFALVTAIVWWKMNSSNTAFRIGINMDPKPSENSRGIAGEGSRVPQKTMTDQQKQLLKDQAIKNFKRNSKDQVIDNTQSFHKEKKN